MRRRNLYPYQEGVENFNGPHTIKIYRRSTEFGIWYLGKTYKNSQDPQKKYAGGSTNLVPPARAEANLRLGHTETHSKYALASD